MRAHHDHAYDVLAVLHARGPDREVHCHSVLRCSGERRPGVRGIRTRGGGGEVVEEEEEVEKQVRRRQRRRKQQRPPPRRRRAGGVAVPHCGLKGALRLENES